MCSSDLTLYLGHLRLYHIYNSEPIIISVPGKQLLHNLFCTDTSQWFSRRFLQSASWHDYHTGPLLGLSSWCPTFTLHWRHNELDGVSIHQPHDCLLSRLFGRRSKKTSKLRVTGLCAGNSPGNSPHKAPVTRKMFPYDDVIMKSLQIIWSSGIRRSSIIKLLRRLDHMKEYQGSSSNTNCCSIHYVTSK